MKQAVPVAGPSAAGSAGADSQAACRLLVILAVVILVVTAVMVRDQWVQPRDEPWRSRELQAARHRLEREPKNEELKRAIREGDLSLRKAYFRGLERNRGGAWLLLASGTLLVVVAHRLRGTGRPSPHRGGSEDRELIARRTRWTSAATGAACVLTLAVVGWATAVRLPDGSPRTAAASLPSDPKTKTGTGSDGVTMAAAPKDASAWLEEAKAQWPRFRGWDGSGRTSDGAGAASVPLTWDVAAGKDVRWKVEVPLSGFSSPVVWKDRVFLTGGNKERREVMCFDAATGALRWSKPVAEGAGSGAVEPPDQSGAAASTPATDGERVYAIFASGEVGALDFEGRLVWSRRVDLKDNGYGHASSLAVWGDRLVIQADQGSPEDGKSVLEACDVRTGKAVWTAKRPVGGSWASPLIWESGGKPVVVTSGDPYLMAHDLGSGAEIWRAHVLGGELAPSPIRAGELIVAVSPGHAVVAVKSGGAGDITESHVAWKLEKEIPDVPTPVVVGDLLFTASTEGHVYCREVASGKTLWDHAFELEFQASPLVVGERIYQLAQPGNVVVYAAAREFKELARFEMGEELYASPAAAGGTLFIRGKKNLYAIGGAAAVGKKSEVAHAR